MVPEAPLEQTEQGLFAAGAGWFVAVERFAADPSLAGLTGRAANAVVRSARASPSVGAWSPVPALGFWVMPSW